MKISVVECKDDKHWYPIFLALPKTLYETNFATNTPSSQYLMSCFLFLMNDVAVGRYALYHNPELNHEGKHALCIGSYEALDDEKLKDFIKNHILDQMRINKKEVLIGPMEGATMNNYRFSNKKASRNFFLEPYHPMYYNDHFRFYGFKPIATYYSSILSISKSDSQLINAFELKLKSKGLRFRQVDMNNFSEDIDGFIALAMKGFTRNFLYTPIDAQLLKEKYVAMEALINEELLCAIEDERGRLQVMFFGYKDLYDPKGETVVYKSVVKRPSFEMKGLVKYLDEKFIQIALDQGYSKMIHAFMYCDNVTKKLSSQRESEELKEYVLYALKL